MYYASSSIYVKSTVFQFYRRIGYRVEITSNYQNIENNDDKNVTKENNIQTKFLNTTQIREIKNDYREMTTNNYTHVESSLIEMTTNSKTVNTTTTILLNTSKKSESNSTSLPNKSNNIITESNKLLNKTDSDLKTCPIIPPNLGTRVKISKKAFPIDKIEKFPYIRSLNLTKGGLGKPKTCKANYKVAIIIPYRDRLENLQLFLNHMHPFLSKQQLEYGIYIAEPVKNITFNRGLLMNIGYAEAVKDNNKWDCFILHDVDLLPEDERNIYSCPEIPRHMSSAVSTLGYKIPYDAIFGGVTGFTKEHFIKINGFSNMYFGWGGEDDDLRRRVIKSGLKVSRYPLEIGRYFMAKHKKDKPNPQRFKLLSNANKRIVEDGISNLKYEVKSIEKNALFTKILVYYNQTAIFKKNKKG